MSIIPLPRTAQTPPDVRFVAWLLEVTEPELWHYGPLEGEDLEETVARIEAARDIAEELAHEWGVAAAEEDGPQWPAPAAGTAQERGAA